MNIRQPITLNRDCEAIWIPSGEGLTLPAGAEVELMQSLGGFYTVRSGSAGSLGSPQKMPTR